MVIVIGSFLIRKGNTTNGKMKLFIILPTLYSLALAALPNPVAHNGVDPKSIKVVHTDQTLVLDADWTYFLFTNVGVPITPNFVFTTPLLPPLTQLRTTDLYCAGDMFRLVNNEDGALFGTDEPFGVDCRLSTGNATLAFSQHYWSRGIIHLNASTTYNMTLYPTSSPWSAGMAAIRWVTSLF